MTGHLLTYDLAELIAAAAGPALAPPAPTPEADIDETAVLAAAEAIIDGLEALEAMQGLVEDQTALAQALVAQASQIVAQGQASPLPPLPAPPPPPPAPVHTTVPAEVAMRARQILAQQPLILDLETTGTAPKTRGDRIVQVAVIDALGRIRYASLVNPGRSIPAEATAIHGITDEHVADAPTWEEIAPELRRRVQGRLVVAHYAAFDAKFLPSDWGIEWVCSKKLADVAFGKWDYAEAGSDWRRSGRLEHRLRQCGLQPGPAHQSHGDCISVLRLLRFIAGYEQTV